MRQVAQAARGFKSLQLRVVFFGSVNGRNTGMKTKGYLAGFEMLESMGVRDEAEKEEKQKEAAASGAAKDGSGTKKDEADETENLLRTR